MATIANLTLSGIATQLWTEIPQAFVNAADVGYRKVTKPVLRGPMRDNAADRLH